MAMQTRGLQDGSSLLGNIFLVALFGYGVYLAIQYLPQYLESESLDSILQGIENQHRSQRYESAQQVEQSIRNSLNLNQMDDMAQHIRVRQSNQGISIEVSYERELDLVFQQKTITVNKTVDLD